MKSTTQSTLFTLFVLLSLLGLAGCQAKTPEAAQPASQAEAPARASSEAGITVEGRLVPRADVNLSFALGGKVGQVLVQEGEAVEAGQVLASLDTTEAELAVQQTEADLAAAQIRYDQAPSTEPARREADITAATLALLQAQNALADLDQNASLETARVQVALASAQKALKEAQRVRTNMNYPRANPTTIDGAKAFYELTEDDLKKAKQDYDQVTDLSPSNPERAQALLNLTDAQKERDRALATLNWYLGKNNEEDIAEADAQLTLAKAELETAKMELDEVKDGPAAKNVVVINEKIANAQALLDLANAQSVSQQIALVQTQLDAAKVRLELAKAQLAKLTLTAPFDGVVTSILFKPGEWANPGQPALVLADLEALRVETTDLSEIDVVGVSVGQAVQISVDALPGLKLTGKVISISDAYQETRGDITYTTRIELDNTDPLLRWGMTVLVTFEEP